LRGTNLQAHCADVNGRLVALGLLAVLLAGCQASRVNVENASDGDVVAKTQVGDGAFLFYRIPPGAVALIACTNNCGDHAPYARYLWIMTAQCQVLKETDVPQNELFQTHDPNSTPMQGTFVVNTGPSVTFDPNDRSRYELSGAFFSKDDPCSK